MPRPAKGPRLVYRRAKRASKARQAEAGGWIIRDGASYVRTGLGKSQIAAAERALADHIAAKHEIPRRQRRLGEIPVSDVIVMYAEDVVPGLATAKKALARLARLADWWGDMMLDEVTGAACRQFAATKSKGAARRELQDLQAAIGYHHKEGYHREIVKVTLPDAGNSRERWLTRSEVARLLWACWRAREVQDGEATDKQPLRHLARYILFAVYTGSRPGDVLLASFFAAAGRGYVDLEAGLYFRKPRGKVETNKRQPTTPLPSSLLAHLRRWRAAGAMSVVEFRDKPVANIKTGFAHAIDLAELPGIVPYTLRHTAATWMLQRGVPTWEVAGYLGTSEQMIRETYGHHSPDNLKLAVGAMSRRQ